MIILSNNFYNLNVNNRKSIAPPVFTAKVFKPDTFQKSALNTALNSDFSRLINSHQRHALGEMLESEAYICKTVPIFSKKTFSKTDYKNLSTVEREVFDALLNDNPTINIRSEAKEIYKISKSMKKNLNVAYPYGYKLVGIGNSPAPFVETMQELGVDTTTIPFSISFIKGETFPFLTNGLEPYSKNDWENYLKFFGLSKDFSEKTGKKILCTDFVVSGASLNAFRKILDGAGFSQKDYEMINLMNLVRKSDISDRNYYEIKNNLLGTVYKYLSQKPSIKYCKTGLNQHIDVIRNPEYIENLGESFSSKLFKYAIFKEMENDRTPFVRRLVSFFDK